MRLSGHFHASTHLQSRPNPRVSVNVARVIKVTAPFPDMKISEATHLVVGSLQLHLKEQDKSGISMSANIANIVEEVNLADHGGPVSIFI